MSVAGAGHGAANRAAVSPEVALALQRTAGNAATTRLMTGAAAVARDSQRTVIQRQKAPPTKGGRKLSPGPKVKPKPPRGGSAKAGLEGRLAATEKRQAATAQDLRWRATFGERLSSWRQAILRISGALELAQTGFREAHMAQQAYEAMVTQIVLAAVSVGFAAGFEPFFALALGRAGKSLDDVTQLSGPRGSHTLASWWAEPTKRDR
jgi:hypothetical protein